MLKYTLCPHANGFNIKYSDLFSSQRDYKFKLEGIFDSFDPNVILGYEILLDFRKAKQDDCLHQYNKAIYDGSAIECLVAKLAKVINSGMKIHVERIFINLERIDLCNLGLLKKIIVLSRDFFLHDVELVVEITERNECGFCPRIMEGLRTFKVNGVSLAADDFDIYSESDFRMREVLAGFYEYIKIEMPKNNRQKLLYNQFIIKCRNLNSLKVIVEKVESINDVPTLTKAFGLQGYAFK